MKCVGMPLSTVTRSRSISRNASAGSQRSIRIIAPPVISGGSTPVHAPAMWKNGMWFITRLERVDVHRLGDRALVAQHPAGVHGALRVAGGARWCRR